MESNQNHFLTEEQTLIKNMARGFAAKELSPNAAIWDQKGGFPKDMYSRMGKLGLMGMMVNQGYGGAAADHVSYALAIEEIAYGDVGTSTAMSVNNSLACAILENFGSSEQKTKYLTKLAVGEMLGAFCLTEPHTGSDAAAIKTSAKLNGNSYILNGTKQFVTSGSKADVALVIAVTDPHAEKKGLTCFLVKTNNPGYIVSRHENKLGQRAHDTCQINFNDMRLTPDCIIGSPGDGYKIALANLEGGRIGVAAQAIGAARAAYEVALQYAQERTSFGSAIIEHQAVAFRLADMFTKIEAARLLTHNAARMRDAGLPCIKEASMAKLFSSEMAEKVCSDAIQILGGSGYISDFPVERFWRDVRVCKIYEGTSDVQRIVISRAIKKESI